MQQKYWHRVLGWLLQSLASTVSLAAEHPKQDWQSLCNSKSVVEPGQQGCLTADFISHISSIPTCMPICVEAGSRPLLAAWRSISSQSCSARVARVVLKQSAHGLVSKWLWTPTRRRNSNVPRVVWSTTFAKQNQVV